MAILVVGSMAYDTIETPRERRVRQLGGAATYFALAAGREAGVRVVAVVGEDFLPADLELLASHGVDLEGVERAAGRSFHWSGRYRADFNERDTLATELGVFAGFRPRVPAGWTASEYLFLANIHPSLQAEVLAAVARPRLVVLDTMNLWIETRRADLLAVLPRVDVLLVNDSEARQLSGELGLAAAAAAIKRLGPARVVIKKGEHGALLFGRTSVLAVPGLLLPAVVDPTGAGDSFAGGFLASLAAAAADRDSDDAPFRAAMLAGTVTASFVPEDFSVGGLLRRTPGEVAIRLARLTDMMVP
ncbi:MAG TPA: PfkB family carbohydrate kinase [Candidatus Krumholzibacteria bacterium]|nr:PfkB family carbohydrate kinase [Candidatus Krumholzibacteria bacterium]HPD71267.1 PfkB family carbohydrate kinase [Candidatus Krumholzibacteria bacterium]HRY39033.1 PfkB family carbohydrate kinase [Candidatus Krumholzibacteria bacterium]